MDSDSVARLIYLVLLGAAVAGWFLAENRANMGKNVRMALAWGMIFLGFLAGYGLWQDVKSDVLPSQAVIADGGAIEVPRGRDGHFHLTLDVNGEPVRFLVDTGASDVVLSMEDAERVGLNLDDLAFVGSARTANGTVSTAFATLDEVRLGPATFRDVGVAVNGGEMPGSLLGMSFLRRFDRLEISGEVLKLEL